MPPSSINRPPEELVELHIRYADTGDPAVRAELVDAYAGLVRSVSLRFAGRGESTEDLIQVGFVGLLEALERFDPHRGCPFPGFAVPTIVGELKRHFRDRRWRIRVPRPVQERYLDVRAARDRLVQVLGRVPAVADIAAELEISCEEVLEAMDAGASFSMASLDSPGGDGMAHPARAGEKGYDAVENGLFVEALLDRLPARQRDVVVLRFHGELTQSEIGRRLGMGQMQVSRTLARTLSSLRARAGT